MSDGVSIVIIFVQNGYNRNVLQEPVCIFPI